MAILLDAPTPDLRVRPEARTEVRTSGTAAPDPSPAIEATEAPGRASVRVREHGREHGEGA